LDFIAVSKLLYEEILVQRGRIQQCNNPDVPKTLIEGILKYFGKQIDNLIQIEKFLSANETMLIKIIEIFVESYHFIQL